MKKILSFVLALLMLVSTLAMTLVSCDEEQVEKKPVTNVDNEQTGEYVEGDIFAERALISDGLGEYDFGGRKLRVVSWTPQTFFVEDDQANKGDLIADAKYNRNKKVENRFNFEMEVAYTGTYSDVVNYVTKNVLAGSDEFDLFCSQTASAAGAVLKNVFLNWYDIPNVDFSKPWWPASNVDDLTYDGKCILAISDFNVDTLLYARCIYFNKNLAAAYDLGNLYQVVKDDQWTFDYFYNMIKDIYTDLDYDGQRSEGDFYGFGQPQDEPIDAWLWAFDNPTVKRDEDGVPVVAIKTSKINNIVDKVYELCWETKGVYFKYNGNSNSVKATDYLLPTNLFLAKRAVFTMATIGWATDNALRNFDDEYGILPMPKWDETQKEYLTNCAGGHNVLAVPKTCTDVEFVGTCIEALSAESYKTVFPTIYEIALKTRYLRDSESKEVLDTLIDGRIFEFGYIYDNWQGFGFMLQKLVESQDKNFESYYAKRYNTARLHYKKVIKVFDKLG